LKGKYDKITNYNLSYENLLEAITEFDGYVMGVSHNDILNLTQTRFDNIVGGSEGLDALFKNSLGETYEDEGLRVFLQHIYSRILDRTTGAYQFSDMFSGNNFDKVFRFLSDYHNLESLAVSEYTGAGEGLGKYMHLILPTSHQTYFPVEKTSVFTPCYSFSPDTRMNKVIRFFENSNELKMTTVTNAEGDIKFDPNTGEPQMRVDVYNNSFDKPGSVEINKDLLGDRFKRPNLSAVVMRHPKATIAGRNKSHLPIFFNAITPVEMSRCTPYIKIEVISQDFKTDSEKISNLNQVGYMRFTKSESGDYELDDLGGFSSTKPVLSDSSKESEIKNKTTTRYSFMDIFNSPQTMSNADINKMGGKSVLGSSFNRDPVLEPVSPMLSLQSLKVDITGAGFGLLASKKAGLSLTLHDRSRMRDIAPLISSTQFSTTKIIIEYGWNHPDGGVNSENVIGKYLNSLKERSIYQVIGSNYSFGDGNTVKIDVDLAAYGFRQNEKIHCGSGPEVPLNMVEEKIKKVTSDIIKGEGIEDAPEVRQEIKLNSRNARSINASISWSAYDQLSPFLREGGDQKKLTDIIKTILIPETLLHDNYIDETLKEEISSPEKEIQDQISRMLGKLADIKKTKPSTKEDKEENRLSADPYLWSTTTGALDGNFFNGRDGESVSLGKVISHFIGHAIASSCLYDEVQLFFYPLNHQAASGRAHTTASLPIPIKKLESAIDEKLNKNSMISVNSFFKLLEKIVRDRNIPAYGLSEVFEDLNKITSLDNDEALDTMKSLYETGELQLDISEAFAFETIKSKGSYDDIFDAEQEKLVKSNNEKLNSLNKEKSSLQKKSNTLKSDIESKRKQLKELPEGDASFAQKTQDLNDSIKEKEAEIASLEKDILEKQKSIDSINKDNDANLFNKKTFDGLKKKVTTKIREKTRKELAEKCKSIYMNDGLSSQYPAEAKFVRPNLSMDFEVLEAIDVSNSELEKFNFFEKFKESKKSTNGHKDDKTILRIHIYDEESILDPASYAMHQTLLAGAENKVINGKDYRKVIEEKLGSGGLNFNDVKQVMKAAYPTIIYGSNGSTVKNISVSANTSGELSQVLMNDSYGQIRDGVIKGKNYENDYESITLLPNTVSLSMLGQPMIGRGNNIFIDFGTNTSLDNIYTVKSVSHSLSKGDFSTTVQLVPSNMGAISSFKERMRNTLDVLEEKS